jgi:Ni,Fe-hydrogenase III large subunit
VGRASARRDYDLRRRAPYADYVTLAADEATEKDGDGYARLRVFLTEAAESARLLGRAVQSMPSGAMAVAWHPAAGAALGWSEAPAGACVHWLRIDAQGRVARWRILPPAFTNWHAFHLATENFAFQDFPITLATMGLSVAETDR